MYNDDQGITIIHGLGSKIHSPQLKMKNKEQAGGQVFVQQRQ
jgi:hypothetical protein